jgi:hypothetical protein
MMSSLGSLTVKGVAVGFFFEHLALAKRKCTVHPESKISVDCDGMDGVNLR